MIVSCFWLVDCLVVVSCIGFKGFCFRYLVVGREDVEVHKREGGLVFLIRFDEVVAVEMVEKRGSLVISVNLARETVYLRRSEGVRDWFLDIKEGVESSRRTRGCSLPLLVRGQERITLQELTMLYKEEEEANLFEKNKSNQEPKEDEKEELEDWVEESIDHQERLLWTEMDSGNSSLQSTSSSSTTFSPTSCTLQSSSSSSATFSTSLLPGVDSNKENGLKQWFAGETTNEKKKSNEEVVKEDNMVQEVDNWLGRRRNTTKRGLYVNTVQITHV